MALEFFKKFIPIGQGEKLNHFKTNSGYNPVSLLFIKPLLFKNLYLEIE